MKPALIEEMWSPQSSPSPPSHCRVVSCPCAWSLLVTPLPTGGWSAGASLPLVHPGDTRQDFSAVEGSPRPWLELLWVLPRAGNSIQLPHGSCCCCLSASPTESSKVCGQERLWNHKLLKVLKTKVISSHESWWRDLSRSCTSGGVGSKLHYLEQLLQIHSDWIMSTYPKGKIHNHSLWVFRYVRSCINL